MKKHVTLGLIVLLSFSFFMFFRKSKQFPMEEFPTHLKCEYYSGGSAGTIRNITNDNDLYNRIKNLFISHQSSWKLDFDTHAPDVLCSSDGVSINFKKKMVIVNYSPKGMTTQISQYIETLEPLYNDLKKYVRSDLYIQ